MNAKFISVMVLVITSAFCSVWVMEAAYPRTFSVLSYSLASPKVEPAVTMSTEGDIPIIVTLKRNLGTLTVAPQAFVMAASEDFSVKYGFDVRNQMFTFEMVSGTIPRENLSQLYRDPRVRGIWYDELIRVPQVFLGSQYENEAVTIEEAREALGIDNLGDGTGVNVVVIDSGASPDVRYVKTWSVIQGEPEEDYYGHGTLVSWIIQQLTPNSPLYSIKVLDRYGMGRLSDVISGLELALDEVPTPMVINISLGLPSSIFDPLSESAGSAVVWHDGVYIFAATGNSGHGVVLSPAASGNVVGVGAVGRNYDYLPFSGGGYAFGNIKPDVVSFGAVWGLWLDEFTHVAGTSIATPMATSVFARWLSGQEDKLKVDPVGSAQAGCIDLGKEGPDTYYGVGGFLTGKVLAQVEPAEKDTPQKRMAVSVPLLGLSAIPAVVVWRKRI